MTFLSDPLVTLIGKCKLSNAVLFNFKLSNSIFPLQTPTYANKLNNKPSKRNKQNTCKFSLFNPSTYFPRYSTRIFSRSDFAMAKWENAKEDALK